MTKRYLLGRITIDPTVCHGKPTIRGLRCPVEAMPEYLAGGDTFEESRLQGICLLGLGLLQHRWGNISGVALRLRSASRAPEFLFSMSFVLPEVEPVVTTAPLPSPVNLLALVDVPRDAVEGNWEITSDGLVTAGGGHARVLLFNQEVPAELHTYRASLTFHKAELRPPGWAGNLADHSATDTLVASLSAPPSADPRVARIGGNRVASSSRNYDGQIAAVQLYDVAVDDNVASSLAEEMSNVFTSDQAAE